MTIKLRFVQIERGGLRLVSLASRKRFVVGKDVPLALFPGLSVSAVVVWRADLTMLSPGDRIKFMITTFHDDETHKVLEGAFSKKLPVQIQAVARRKLRMINNARRIEDLRIPPNNRPEGLKGNRKGQWWQWSIRINEQWRVCFVWNDGHAERLEICDYH